MLNAHYEPYGIRVDQKEILVKLYRLFMNNFYAPHWHNAISKETGKHPDAGHFYDLATEYYENPKKFPELHRLVLSINS